MSGSNFNITDLIPSRQGFNIREVHSTADLPPNGTGPNDGFRDFPLNEALDIRATIVDGLVWRWPDESFIFIWTKYANQATLVYTGSSAFIQCAGQVGTTIFRNTNIFGLSTASTAMAFDLTASLNVGPASFGVNDTAFVGFPGGARYKNFPNGIIRGMVWFNDRFASTVSESFRLENCGVYELGGMLMIGIGNTNQALLAPMGPATGQARIHDCDWNVPGTQSGLYFGENITTAAAIGAFSVSQPNTGTFFKTQQSGTYATASDGSTNGTVTSVTGRVTLFGTFAVFLATTTPLEGDIINHVGFAEASYNGKFKAHRVDAGVSYQIALFPFQQPVLQTGATTGGTWDREYTLLNSTDTSELRIGCGVEITVAAGESSYAGIHTVLELVDNVSFSIQADFIATANGTFIINSLDETAIQVDIDRAGAQKVSMTIGSLVIGANATATVIATQNVFVPLNFGASVALGGNNERFELVDGQTGEIRYVGKNPMTMTVTGLIGATSTGGGQRFNFRALKNGSVLPAPDNVDVPIEVGNNLSAVSLLWDINMSINDTFEIQVENADGTSNITIDTFKLDIS